MKMTKKVRSNLHLVTQHNFSLIHEINIYIISLSSMVPTVTKVWHKSRYLGNPSQGPVSKTDAIIFTIVHVNRKICFYGIEHKFNWSVNRIIWSTEYDPVPQQQESLAST